MMMAVGLANWRDGWPDRHAVLVKVIGLAHKGDLADWQTSREWA